MHELWSAFTMLLDEQNVYECLMKQDVLKPTRYHDISTMPVRSAFCSERPNYCLSYFPLD